MTQNEPCCLHQSQTLLDDDDDKLVIKKTTQKSKNVRIKCKSAAKFKVDTKV